MEIGARNSISEATGTKTNDINKPFNGATLTMEHHLQHQHFLHEHDDGNDDDGDDDDDNDDGDDDDDDDDDDDGAGSMAHQHHPILRGRHRRNLMTRGERQAVTGDRPEGDTLTCTSEMGRRK